MKEAHAWRIGTDYFFRGLRLGFHAFEAGCRLLKLRAKCGHVAGPGARDFLAQLIRLLFELLLLLVNIGLLKIGARTAGIRHQWLLAVSATLELGDNGERPVSFLVGTPGIEKKDRGDEYGDGEEGRDANFQSPSQGKSIARHLFGYSKRLESGLRHFAAFIGNASFLQQFVKGVFFAQLNAHARQHFPRIPRSRNHPFPAATQPPPSPTSLPLPEP